MNALSESRELLLPATIFGALGAYLFLITWWWFNHLVAIAKNVDLSERRKMHRRQFAIFASSCGLPVLAAIIWVPFPTHLRVVLPIMVIAAVLPALYVAIKSRSAMRDLGYGLPKRRMMN
jgi:hypothetical protein